MRRAHTVCLATAIAVATGCASEEPAPADSGTGRDSAPAPRDGDTTRFTMVYNIFSANCGGAACHLRSSAASLDMSDRETAYEQLVGTPAQGPSCDGEGTRVVPGEPGASLLIEKLTSPLCGGRMPQGDAPLTRNQVERIRSWIAAGARND